MPRFMLLALFLLLVAAPVLAEPASDKSADAQDVIDKALAYLVTQQKPNGSFQRSDREPGAISALVLKALAQDKKYGPGSEPAKKAAEFIVSMQKPDGGLYQEMIANYSTAVSVSGLASLNDPAQKERIGRAIEYLKSKQFSESIAGANGQKIKPEDFVYGGWNYGGSRGGGGADLSNTSVMLDALKDAGLQNDDPAYQRALAFVTRMQNNSESNKADWAGEDGGFIYSTGKTGEGGSAAGEFTAPDGKRRVRSYGSMTYAGLKSMMYAGLSKDDPRVKAAWKWITSNWTLDEHPGMRLAKADAANDGIYYYYHTVARALSVYGEPMLKDSKGVTHDWRVELIAKLESLQKPDGSFVGTRAWMEDNPILSTTMAVLALQDAARDLKEHPARK